MFAAERVSWEWVCAVGQSVCSSPPPETSTLYSPCWAHGAQRLFREGKSSSASNCQMGRGELTRAGS